MRRRHEPRDDNTSERYEAYVARTENPLNLLALFTMWIVFVPVANFGDSDGATIAGIALRVAVSAVFGIDLVIRAALTPAPLRYVATHPIRLLAVVLPPVRVVFSFQLISSLFKRGNLVRFLLAAAILMLDGALIVYFFERDAAGATITTPARAIWWGIVTVATVGYGDMFPITLGGRVVAALVMAVGITTIAVVTAQVSSSFVSQARSDRRAAPRRALGRRDRGGDEDAPGDSAGHGEGGSPPAADRPGGGRNDDDVVQELLDRLDRIERQLTELGERPR